MDKDKDKKLVSIDINADEFEVPKGKLSYERVVELGFSDFAQYPDATYSVVYERGSAGRPQGTLAKGESVQIVEGMRFRAKRTGES